MCIISGYGHSYNAGSWASNLTDELDCAGTRVRVIFKWMQMDWAPQEMLCSPKCAPEHGLSQMRAPAETAWVYYGVKIPSLYLDGSCSAPGPKAPFTPVSHSLLRFESPEGDDNSRDLRWSPGTCFLPSIPGETYVPWNVCDELPRNAKAGMPGEKASAKE